MTMHLPRFIEHRKVLIVVIALYLCASALIFSSGRAEGLNGRYVKIGNSVAGSTTSYEVGFNYTNTASAVGSVVIQYCSNYLFAGESCNAPAGFDASGATLSSQTGEVGYSIFAGSTANKVILSRTPSVPADTSSSYTFDTVVNPSATGSFYVRISTYSSTDGTGTEIEGGSVVLRIVNALSITTTVPPYLTFCASASITGYDCATATNYYIDFGEFTTTAPATATSEMVVTTNAPDGYSITLSGPTLTSGNNIIPALASPSDSTPSTSQFGINLRSNTSPSVGSNPSGYVTGGPSAAYDVPNKYVFKPNDIIASSNTTSDSKKYTISYIANIASSQPAGFYATTLTFICLANF